MDQKLRSPDLTKGTRSILSSHMVAHKKCTSGPKDQHLLLPSADTRHAHGVQLYMQAKYQYTQNNNKQIKKTVLMSVLAMERMIE